jgi:hypothetical protein
VFAGIAFTAIEQHIITEELTIVLPLVGLLKSTEL